ncbi:MAG: type III-B CRISPR-associated protein Cas10/Cmr2 [Desulfobacterales bacterium]|nr:type III-B CRISPR-associated protein Cas10/Cmr2 [Desulfobacterales bacterium]
MTFTTPDSTYWENKLAAYLHDPLDKVFQISGHENRAAIFLDKYGIPKPNDEFWKKADGIAAGFERGQVPSYSTDSTKNGSVDFIKNPVISHPTSEKAQLKINIPDAASQKDKNIHDKLIEFIKKDIGMKAGQGGYSDQFKGEEKRFAIARFLYTHLVLRFKLAEKNVGGLGAFWHRIPADTRFPDHSIWQHNALCSALSSCIQLSGNHSEIGIMVFSITPVQSFIAKARKLRDYWTGSVLLSWLAFEGMRWVIEHLGPDHILYPSLIDQPLVNEYMKKEWKISEAGFLEPPNDIASFPNKFVFLIPMNHAETIAEDIKIQIQSAWKNLYEKVYDTCISKLDSFLSNEAKEYVKTIFDRQNSTFWELQWSASYLLKEQDKPEIDQLIPEKAYENPFAVLKVFNKIIEDKIYYEKSGQGVLYSVSHLLAQSALAASKIKKTVTRHTETGEKCHLCGEFEVVHHQQYKGTGSANEYKENTKKFWRELKLKWDGDEKSQLGFNLNKNEKLCSICLIKRMVYEAMKVNKNYILHNVFKNQHLFPSTTYIALTDYFERKNIHDEKERRKKAQEIHEKSDSKTDNQDRYFAILLMDGDNMGKLVNGETLASTWESIMHPEIVERLKKPEFEKKFHDNWQKIYNQYPKRLLTPAIHAAISESLGDFSLYGVSRIIETHQGKLIYAGGDDVCAVLPVQTVLNAAEEIQQYYTSTYKFIQKHKEPEDIEKSWSPKPGKLSINLGKGDGISISAGILICHHKESLTQMIANAQYLLKHKAKTEAKRNACAIELRKRSGGSRYFVRKWNDHEAWESFSEIGRTIKSKHKAQVSSSVVYRLEQLRDGIEAILKQPDWRTMLESLIVKQLDKSSLGDKKHQESFAKKMVDIMVYKTSTGKYEYQPEGLIIAAFMAKGGEND